MYVIEAMAHHDSMLRYTMETLSDPVVKINTAVGGWMNDKSVRKLVTLAIKSKTTFGENILQFRSRG